VFWCVLIGATVAFIPKKGWKLDWRASIPAVTPLEEWWAKIAFGLLLIAGVIVFSGDLTPETFYDSLHYHLAVPSLYLLHHRIYNEPNFAYATFIMVVQMFWGFGLTVGNEITVKILHGSMLVLLFFTFIALERRYLARNSGLLGMLLFVSIPLVGSNATTAGIDVASSVLQFLAVFALIRALAANQEEVPVKQWLRLAGLFTGIAATCRYTFLPSIPIACFAIAWTRKRQGQKWTAVIPQLRVFLIYAALVMFPFYLKNVVFHYNPVYPIAGMSWGQPRVAPENWQNIMLATVPPDLSRPSSFLHVGLRFISDTWTITMKGQDATQDFVGPLLLGLLPLLLLVRPGNVASSVLSGYSLWLWITWLFTNTIHLRFGMPLLAILSILLAHLLLSIPSGRVLKHAVLAFCLLGTGLNLYYTFLISGYKEGWRVVGGMTSEEEYLATAHYAYPTPDYEGLIWMNRNLPAGSRVMMAGDPRSFYTTISVVPASIFDTQPIVLTAQEAQSGDDMARLLRERGITHLFLNFGEAMRDRSYGIFPWNEKTWHVFDDFWRGHVRLIWGSVSERPAKALFVYEVRSNLNRADPANIIPPNLFEVWKPKAVER
jgi:hypothetical protein